MPDDDEAHRTRRLRVDKAVAAGQKAMVEEVSKEPDVPPMESLIAQAVANNSREIELTQRAERAEARLRVAEAEINRVQNTLVASQKETIEVYRKLTLALEEVNRLTPLALAWENRE